jgi:amino acid transporter
MAAAEQAQTGLRAGSVGLPGLLSQSISGVGPEIAAVAVAGSVAVFAGADAPAAFLIGIIAAIAISLIIAYLARRGSTAGGMYPLTAKVLGKSAGTFVGWALLITYLNTVAGVAILTGVVLQSLFDKVAPSVTFFTNSWIPAAIIVAGLALIFAYLGIRVAVEAMLTVTVVGCSCILIMAIFVLSKGGAHGIVWSSLIPGMIHGIPGSKILIGVGVAFITYAGFETATNLGEEARRPRRDIPISLVATVVVLGVFFLIVTLATVSGYGTTPKGIAAMEGDGFLSVVTMSDRYVTPWFGDLLLVVIAVASFNSALAAANGASRMLLSWGRDGQLPKVFGHVGRRFRTPYVGIATIAVICALYFIAATLWQGGKPAAGVIVFAWVVLLATVCGILAYLVIIAAGTVASIRAKGPFVIKFVAPLIAAAVLCVALYSQYVPTPSSPYTYAPYVALAALVLGTGYLLLGSRRRGQLGEAGQVAEEALSSSVSSGQLSAEAQGEELAP